mmetsp:Transcript_5519/g.13308  ORF Transcript_5519/g.13308 Transcript_5519/m.13308 type:complete len:408 (+) Transcript_5519:1230-2453(+)
MARQPCRHAHALEEGAGGVDGRVDAAVLGALGQAPDALGVLQQLGSLGLAAGGEHRGQHDGQGLGMVQPMHGRDLVAQHVGAPVLRHAGAEVAVERHGRRPHHIGAGVVVARVGQQLGAFLDQGQQQALGHAVLHLGIGRIGQVLLDGVDKGVDHAVAGLALRQAEQGARVQYREAREDLFRREEELVAGLAPADDGARVHLRAGRGQGQHHAQRHRGLDLALAGQQFPGVALVVQAGSNEFAAVGHRAAADGEHEVDAMLAPGGDGPHQRGVVGVGLDAAKLDGQAIAQGLAHLFHHAVAQHAAAAIGHQHPAAGRHLFRERCDLALAKQHAGRDIEIEVVHPEALVARWDPGPAWCQVTKGRAAAGRLGPAAVALTGPSRRGSRPPAHGRWAARACAAACRSRRR